MKQYAAALALVLCLTLTACGVREDNRGQGLFQRTSGVEEDAVLLTVDGRDQALADTALYATVENWADFHGCALDEEDQAALEAAWAEKTAEYGGEKAYLQALAEMGLDRARMEELTGVGRLYAKLYSLYCQEGSALAPEPEALEACGGRPGGGVCRPGGRGSGGV